MSWSVGIVGCGRMGRRHARAFSRDPRFRLASAVEPDQKRLEGFRSEWKIPEGFGRLEDLLSGQPPEVLILCSPTEFHFPQIRQILSGSKRLRLLLVEKPVCLKREELTEILRLARESDVAVMVNHTRRFDPPHRKLAEWTRSGRFGNLLEGSCATYGGWLNNGTHWIDLLRMLFPQEPQLLSARSAGFGRGSDTDLHVELQVGEAPVHLQAVDEKRYQLFEGEFRFERGRVRILDFGKRIEVEEARVNEGDEAAPHQRRGTSSAAGTVPPRSRELVPVEGSPWRGLEKSMPALAEAAAAVLQGGPSSLEEPAQTMKLVWAAQEMANPEKRTFGEEESQAALEVLQRGQLSLFEGTWNAEAPFSFWGGPFIQKLERAWESYYDSPHAVSMNSATSGLIAAIGALEVGYGDEVIVSPYTMSAAASCALVYGAIPVFADVKLETGSLDPASIERRITARTRAIVAVHQFGLPAEMGAIMALARKHGLKVVEDCAQAHGAKADGRFVGTFGDIGVFSLNVNKTIHVGEGGVCVTRDPKLRDRLALIRNHAEAVVEQAGAEPLTNLIGFNFRLTEIAAAMALEQLKKLDRFNRVRRDLVERLNRELSRFPFLVPPPSTEGAAYYIYPLRFLPETAGTSRAEFVRRLQTEGVVLEEGYVRPLYLQPLYQRRQLFKHGYPFTAPANQGARMEYERGTCPNAEKLHFEQMLISEIIRPPHGAEELPGMIRGIEKTAAAMLESVR